ncbi:hypothetical protein ACVWYH_001200 [Bradyrhizobium sp. GM24.11]
MKRLMRPATCGTNRYALNRPAAAAPARPNTQIMRMPAMKNSEPHTIRISIVWPKSGSITSSDTSIRSSTSAIEVAGISGRLVDSANSQAAMTTKDGFAISEAWMLTPSSVIQRREPLTSGPIASVTTIRMMLTVKMISALRRIERGDRKENADQHHEGRRQEHHVPAEEVEGIEPDAGRDRRARRQRQDDSGQHQHQDRAEQRLIDGPPPLGKGGAFFTGEHGRPLSDRGLSIGRRGWLPGG